ncbi:TPA: hypothetical protein LUX65_004469, partial [Enterobacter hormaechei]|nr:hypothetical protein [Enterobacter hormaechei]
IELSQSPFRLYSDKIKSRYHHIAAFNLSDEEERLGFFTLSDGVTETNILGNVIKMKK